MTLQTRTYELRFERGIEEDILEANARFFSTAKRKLHVKRQRLDRQIRIGEVPANQAKLLHNELKRNFCAEFGISSRQYNSLQRSLDGAYDSIKELAKTRVDRLKDQIKTTAKHIAEQSKTNDRGRKKATDDPQKRRFVLHQKKRRLARLEHQLSVAQAVASEAIPKIVFGSKSLLRKRQSIHPNDKAGQAAWRAKWEASRNDQFLIIGSSDETAGNQTCQGMIIGDRLVLSLKLPDGLQNYAENRDRAKLSLPIPAYCREAISKALTAPKGQRHAVAYRFVKDADYGPRMRLSPWKLLITITEEHAGQVVKDKLQGPVLGVDINSDHLAVTLVDRHGNPTLQRRFELHPYGKTTEQRRELISDAVTAIIDLAKTHGASIAMENLDFKKKKDALSKDLKFYRDKRGWDKGYARMLSSLSYAQITSDLERKAIRAGLTLCKVNPAYTSLIGLVNYASRYGLSRHTGAACAIARRAQGFSERINYIYGLRGDRNALPAPEDAGRHIWSQWRVVHKLRGRNASAFASSRSSAFTSVIEDVRGVPPLTRIAV